jgi:protein-tyrosine phosphatase
MAESGWYVYRCALPAGQTPPTNRIEFVSSPACARRPIGRVPLRAMIDLHSHILPGLDDGAPDLAAAIEIARSMAQDGVRVVAATPHVRDDYPTAPEQMERALRDVRTAIAGAGVDLDVRPGGEIAIERLESLDDDALRRFGLGGNPGLLLIEFPYYGWPLTLPLECARLRREGIVPVIAHPERNQAVQERPSDIATLVQSGAVIQLTAASIDLRLGRAAAACARTLLDLELAHLIASDAHAPGVRQAGLSAAANAVGGALGEWLTNGVPAALLAGTEMPPRPPMPRRRTLRQRLRPRP